MKEGISVMQHNSVARIGPPDKRDRLWRDIKRAKYLYIMIAPIVVYLIVFKYLPMGGIVIAFKDFKLGRGILGSEWVGLKNFHELFRSPDFKLILRNSIMLNVYLVVFTFPIPVILALLLNELRAPRFKRVIQSILYLPHFISWVVMSGILIAMLSPSSGVVNRIIMFLGGEPIYFMADKTWWVITFVASSVWKEAGWGTIIFLAAISGIDMEQYEAARIDGANRFQQVWHITLPAILPTVSIMLILRMGSMMDVGFEHVYTLQNSYVRSVSDVFSVYVFRIGIERLRFSYTSAIGLFQSVVNLIILLGTNFLAKKVSETSLF